MWSVFAYLCVGIVFKIGKIFLKFTLSLAGFSS